MLTVGSCFTGIGGIDIGLSLAGLKVLWQIEIDPQCQRILKSHWPITTLYKDICNVPKTIKHVDVITGGIPCQPTSQAAARTHRGKHWMWPPFFNLIKTLKPKYVIIENPQSLRFRQRGLGEILQDLAQIGYDAEWSVLRASDIGAPHRRARIWVVAHPHSKSKPDSTIHAEAPLLSQFTKTVPWPDPPKHIRMASWVPHRYDRLRMLGNAAMPAMAHTIGEYILNHNGES